MADIRIKDLPTTASQTASDDFIALDGTVNGTRKIDASAPSFKTSVTSPSVAAPAATNLTLAGGTSGASLVLGHTAGAATFNRNITVSLTPSGNPELILSSVTGTPILSLFGTGPTAAVDPFVAFPTAGNLRFGTATGVGAAGASEKARVTNTGNLLIGTTTDISGTGGLKVAGTSTASSTTSGALRVGSNVGLSGNAGGASYFGGKVTSAASTATGYNQLFDTTGITTGRGAFAITSTGAGLAFGIEASAGGTSFTGSTAYASYFGTTTATPIHFVTNSVIRQTIDSTGAAAFAGAVLNSNGTSAAPSLSFSADSDTGFYSSAANTISVSVGGARGFDFSGSGFTLRGVPIIGTDAIAITAGGTNRDITLTPSGTGSLIASGTNNRITFVNSGGPTVGYDGTFDGLQARTASTVRYIITNGGRHLFGTSLDSGALLQVGTNTTTSAGGMVFGTDVSLFRNAATELTTNASAFKITPASGNAFSYNTVTGGGISGFALIDSQASGRTFGIETGRTAGVFSIRDYTASSNRLTIDSTGAATFAGAVAIGNTVNTVSPTSPNRTVTMVIGGVTYYLAAKTTND